MDMMLNETEEQILDAARGLLSRALVVAHTRWEPDAAAAPDRAMLTVFAEQGWLAMGLPEAAGGIGFSVAEEALLLREAGRMLVTPMLMAGIIAGHVAAAAAPDVLAGIVAGETRCGIAIADAAGGWYLIDAADADLVLLVEPEALALAARAGFRAAPLPGLDGTVSFERAGSDAPALARIAGAAAAPLLDRLSLLITAQLVGGAEAVRDLTVSHASERQQFGQKIGTFQAVSHPLADIGVRCEAAWSQLKFAAVALRDGRADASFHVAAARIVAVNTALTNAAHAVQLHGAMGFTAEYPIHFFLKRARLLDQIGGRQAQQLDRFIAMAAA